LTDPARTSGPPPDLAGCAVTVMGVGRFGGGIGVARWLCGQGARVTLTDLADAAHLADTLTTIDDLVRSRQVRLHLGGHDADDFIHCDLVVANPAVQRPWQNEFLDAAGSAGVPVTTEVRLLVERLDRDSVIGITGTAGKSTTAAMVAHVLRRCGRPAHLGGNIGGSLLDSLPRIGRHDPVVLELSSFMLHWLGADVGWPGAPAWSPGTALLTNIAPNHLDWHESYDHYARTKRNIFGPTGTPHGPSQLDGEALPEPFRSLEIPPGTLALPGAHNRQNARMALAVASTWLAGDARGRGATPSPEPLLEPLLDALRSFRGLPHRMELVLERDGLTFVNDSKSTTPESTLQAVAALAESVDRRRIHLIAGGYDKGSDLSAITALAAELGGLYGIGATASRIADHAAAHTVETLEKAVIVALQRMHDGDTLLLSPGCASWDQFDNYEERGERFRHLVLALGGVASTERPHGMEGRG